MDLLYFDSSTAARPSPEAINAMLPYLGGRFGHPLSPHQMGQRLYPALEETYRSLYQLLGASEEDLLFFTASGEEAVNWAIASTYSEVTLATGKNQYIAAVADEAAALMALSHLEKLGCVVKLVQPDRDGRISAEAIGDAMSPRTAMVSLSWANGLTGVIQPVEEIGSLCEERGVLFHLDATHVLGKLNFELEDVGAGMISFHGSQLHAPQGTGGLYVKQGVPLRPLIFGGLSQGGKRGSTLDVAGLVALGVAARQAQESSDYLCTEIARLRNRLERGICDAVPSAEPLFTQTPRLPHCSAISFKTVASEALLFALDRRGLCASMGGGPFQQIGHLLRACSIEERLAQTAISFSLSRETTKEAVEEAIKVVAEAFRSFERLTEGLF